MKTNEELAVIIAKQTPGNDPKCIIIKSSVHMDAASRVIFDYVGEDAVFRSLPAVVCDDEICFTPYDWESLSKIEWYDHEHGMRGVTINGRLRLFQSPGASAHKITLNKE